VHMARRLVPPQHFPIMIHVLLCDVKDIQHLS